MSKKSRRKSATSRDERRKSIEIKGKKLEYYDPGNTAAWPKPGKGMASSLKKRKKK